MKKKFVKSMLGVTLLEIMLVLAIAAMIIVMSVRYYQSASASQQANITLAQIQAITAAADSLSQASGTYSGNATTSKIQSLLPATGLKTPWGTNITITAGSGSQYTVTIPKAPQAICNLVVAQLAQNNHFQPTPAASCPAGQTDISYKYVSNP